MKRWFLSVNALVVILGLRAAEAPPRFAQDFSKIEPGALPDEFLVLDGQFAVKEEGGNRFVELPGAPLESYGFLFGSNEPFDIEASARIFGTKTGRKFPTFGLGLYNSSGYRLQVAPAKEAIELLRGETVVASAPFKWASGQWTQLRLAVRKVSDHEFRLEGAAWTAGQEAPKEPLVTFTDAKVPPPGKASVWGLPFSGTPIRFDDLKVIPLGGS